MKRILKIYFGLLLLLVALTFGSVQAQTNMTKIKDASIAGTSVTPVNGAVLELESNSKGFLAPRMTTAQRDAIATANRTDGLLIYNTTTGCFNHWSASQTAWLSICGTPPPAELSILQCSDVHAVGTYTQGQALDGSNFITIPVVVSQAGNYVVSATTNNGYYFEKSGNFPAPGNYILNVPGMGTPQLATASPGDLLEISFNGVKDLSCHPPVPITAALVNYNMDCSKITVEGQYNIGIPLSASNKMKVEIAMVTSGFWSINTGSEVNGIKFSGSGTINAPGTYTVELLGSGKPLADGTFNYTLTSNVSGAPTCSQSVTVSPVAYTLDCPAGSFQGVYTHNVALDAGNTFTLPVDVTATGTTTITSNTVNGITFSSGPITFTTIGIQNVVLTGTGIPTTAGVANFTFTGTPGAVATCSQSLNVQAQPVNFSMTCGSITLMGDYAPEMLMTTDNKMKISVNVSYPGPYTINTDTQNGISFSASGSFVSTGVQDVVLQASGTTLTRGDYVYTLNSTSSAGVKTCTKNINFLYRTINILGLGGGVYQPGSTTTTYSARAILAAGANFSPTGKVPVQSLNIIDGAYSYDNALKSRINTDKIDVIIIGYDYKPNAATVAILTDFVKNKKGVLLHSEQGAVAQIQNLINNISGGAVTVAVTGTTLINPTAAIIDPILVGPFGDASSKHFGNDVNDANYVTNIPSSMTALATQNGAPTRAAILKHNTLGYVFYGDSGWMAGTRINGALDSWPSKIDNADYPVPKPYSGSTDVYNSIIYANSMTWAIKYVQNNTLVSYVIP